MIKYYTNRELSQKLGINLAKWKRWSREFLEPDPLGGMQSGYARQYNIEKAFTVYLGGHLVSEMKFAVPEAKQILNDLHRWVVDRSVEYLVKRHIIFIYCRKSKKTVIAYYYKIRKIISDEMVDYKGLQVRQERFLETTINPQGNREEPLNLINIRMLNITELHRKFLAELGLSGR